MKNILKQYVVRATALIHDPFQKATLLLTVKYSGLIFLLLAIFGVSVYVLFTLQQGVPIGDGPLVGVFQEEHTHHEASEKFLQSLLLLHIGVWAAASILSYFFARTTLRPVQQMYLSQEKFVADVAHELRTPLTVLQLGAQTLLQKERTSKEYISFITEVDTESRHLVTLVNDLLSLMSFSHVTSLEKETIAFSSLVEKEVAQIERYARTKEVTLESIIDDDIYIRGVEKDIVRMLTNILRNAIEYNHKGGTVKVTLKQERSLAICTVSDTGIGISQEDMPHIFNRFYKADTARKHTHKSEGGLGLFIVREIVNAHSGTVTAQSDGTKGTTLTVSIPCV